MAVLHFCQKFPTNPVKLKKKKTVGEGPFHPWIWSMDGKEPMKTNPSTVFPHIPIMPIAKQSTFNYNGAKKCQHLLDFAPYVVFTVTPFYAFVAKINTKALWISKSVASSLLTRILP